MCGRYVVARATPSLVAFYDVDDEGAGLPQPNANIRPTDPVPIVVDVANSASPTGVRRRVEAARWSLIPSFAREAKLRYPTFNARSETAATTASFRDSVAGKRCLIPADGYYEWRAKEGATGRGGKTPYFVSAAGADAPEPLTFAGLYSWWANPTVDPADPTRWVLSATILTRAAPPHLADLHDRTPVCLSSDTWGAWLDPHTTGDQSLVDAMVRASDRTLDGLDYYPVEPPRGQAPTRLAAL